MFQYWRISETKADAETRGNTGGVAFVPYISFENAQGVSRPDRNTVRTEGNATNDPWGKGIDDDEVRNNAKTSVGRNHDNLIHVFGISVDDLLNPQRDLKQWYSNRSLTSVNDWHHYIGYDFGEKWRPSKIGIGTAGSGGNKYAFKKIKIEGSNDLNIWHPQKFGRTDPDTGVITHPTNADAKLIPWSGGREVVTWTVEGIQKPTTRDFTIEVEWNTTKAIPYYLTDYVTPGTNSQGLQYFIAPPPRNALPGEGEQPPRNMQITAAGGDLQ